MHEEAIKIRIERLENKLASIHKRLQWIANEDAKSPHNNEQAHYFKDKENLLKKAESALDEISKLLNKPWC